MKAVHAIQSKGFPMKNLWNWGSKMAMIFDKEFYYQREHYNTRAVHLVRENFYSEDFHNAYSGLGTSSDGNREYGEYLESFAEKILKLVHNAEYNIFYLILRQIYAETDGIIPDIDIAKAKFLAKDFSKHRIYMLMLLEDIVRNHFIDEGSSENYKSLFKIRDEPP